MVQTTDHSAVQPSSQNQINPARQLGGSGSQGYKTLTSQGEVNTKLGWSLKSKRIVKLDTFRLESPESVPLARPLNAYNLKRLYM